MVRNSNFNNEPKEHFLRSQTKEYGNKQEREFGGNVGGGPKSAQVKNKVKTVSIIEF